MDGPVPQHPGPASTALAEGSGLRGETPPSTLARGHGNGPGAPGPSTHRMLEHYLPILILLGMVLGFAVVNILISDLLGGHRKGVGKGSAYECGMQPVGTARVRLSIHFYLVAVLFILFDVESVFLVLWAVGARSFAQADVGLLVFSEIVLFVGLLVLALAYVWRKGGLDWDR